MPHQLDLRDQLMVPLEYMVNTYPPNMGHPFAPQVPQAEGYVFTNNATSTNAEMTSSPSTSLSTPVIRFNMTRSAVARANSAVRSIQMAAVPSSEIPPSSPSSTQRMSYPNSALSRHGPARQLFHQLYSRDEEAPHGSALRTTNASLLPSALPPDGYSRNVTQERERGFATPTLVTATTEARVGSHPRRANRELPLALDYSAVPSSYQNSSPDTGFPRATPYAGGNRQNEPATSSNVIVNINQSVSSAHGDAATASAWSKSPSITAISQYVHDATRDPKATVASINPPPVHVGSPPAVLQFGLESQGLSFSLPLSAGPTTPPSFIHISHNTLPADPDVVSPITAPSPGRALQSREASALSNSFVESQSSLMIEDREAVAPTPSSQTQDAEVDSPSSSTSSYHHPPTFYPVTETSNQSAATPITRIRTTMNLSSSSLANALGDSASPTGGASTFSGGAGHPFRVPS
ncbi:hypothetical protein C8Q76DRAFT_790218 [Earliella scabrosa]|nr:hypothetical protein C8Q76DRAFT_790218 [Earliella scabrosa]